MSVPIVSAIIPAFNREQSIGASIESALVQSVREIEVIVVDDASTDGTRDVVRQFTDPRVRLICRNSNGGASAARNDGIRNARGQFIAFLDSDDVWLEGKLHRQLEALQRAPSHMAVSCTGVEMHLLDHGVTRIQYLEATEDWGRRLALNCDLSPGTTQLSRREVFDEVGLFDETLPRFEDWDWLLRYTRQAGIVAVRDPLARVYNRRARLGDVVEASAVLFLSKHRRVLQSLPPRERRQAITDLWLQVTGTYAFEGRWNSAIPSAAAAFQQRPLHVLGRLVAGGIKVGRGRLLARQPGRQKG